MIIAAIFLNLSVHKLDDVRVVHSSQNGDFIPEASDPIVLLQPLLRVHARKFAAPILDDKDNALGAFIQRFLHHPAVAINLRALDVAFLSKNRTASDPESNGRAQSWLAGVSGRS